MTVGDLFAGIGGFSLGFLRAGFDVIWQVEIDEECRKSLRGNFPYTERYGDIRDCGRHNLEPVDVICGGFPCQPFSGIGKRKSTQDDRYLWPEMLRVIRELQPSWVVAENVHGLTLGEMESVFEQVLSDLEGEGYDVQPFIIPACGVDAPHLRYRVWIVAHSKGLERYGGKAEGEGSNKGYIETGGQSSILGGNIGTRSWISENGMARVDYGISSKLVSGYARGYGNAVVPQIPEIIARIILLVEEEASRIA